MKKILVLLTIAFTSICGFSQSTTTKPKESVAPTAAPKTKPATVKAPISQDSANRVKLRIRQFEQKTQAHFPEGDVALFTLLAHTLKYSPADIEKKVHGNVLIRFDVDADSTVKEVRLIRDPCVDCGKAIVRIFESLIFIPAQTKSGLPMRSNMMLEIPVWAH